MATDLESRGASVLAVDPLVSDWAAIDAVEPVTLAEAKTRDVDAVALVTPHDEFRDLDWGAFDAPVLDGRNVLADSQQDVPVYTVGGRWPGR
jgi:UDP-N-acetyl-D-mannosaminuronic acid dehydrogenase